MIQIAVSFLLGALIFQTVPTLPPWYVLLIVPIIIVLFKYYPKGYLLYIIIIGFLWSYLHATFQLRPAFDANLHGNDIEVQGSIDELTHQTGHYTRFILTTKRAVIKNSSIQLPKKLILSWYQPEHKLHLQQNCNFVVRLKPFRRLANPGSSDIEKTMFLKGIGARGYVRSNNCETFNPAVNQSLTLRQRLMQRFSQQKDQLDYYAWMLALSYGVRDDLSQQDWQVLRRSGTAHLVAISGLHLSVIALFVYFTCRQCARLSATLCSRFGAQRIAAICTMLAVISYAYLAGFSIPTQRALIMVCMALLAIIFNQPVISFSLLATTMLALLVWDPLTVLTASFWLSFTAVLGIFFIIKSATSLSKWWLAMRIHLFLALALFPMSLWFFQESSLISPLVNFIAVPYISFIVLPILLFTQCLLIFGLPFADSLFALVDVLFEFFWWFVSYMASLPWASYSYHPSIYAVFLFMLGWLLFLFAKQKLFQMIAILLCAGLFLLKPTAIRPGQLRLTILDVGQGLSLLIETDQRVMLYDVGAQFPSGFNMVEAVVLPYLKTRQIRSLDKLVISHHDNDHAGGLDTILASGMVKNLMFGHTAQTAPMQPVQYCQQGDEWSWGEVHFRVLHPPANWQADKNNSSCVIQILHPAGTILLTGDIEAEVEYRLLTEFGDNLHSDILIVPHHGSLSSSSAAFLQAVNPKYAVFSTGYLNRYGFPHATIQARYQKYGVKQLDTSEVGAIVFKFDIDTGIQQNIGYRKTSQRYWHSSIKD